MREMDERKIKKRVMSCFVTRIEPAEKRDNERKGASEIQLNDENMKG